MYPVHSFLDPAYTQSVPPDYTAYGIVDLVAHSLEAWFGEGDATLSDRFVISIIQEAMEFGPALMKDLDNYELRARIMWAATNALNNMTIYGRASGDWGVHALGHVLSFLYDTPHGATLSIMYPAWMKVHERQGRRQDSELGRSSFGATSVDETIANPDSIFHIPWKPCHAARMQALMNPTKEEILSLMNRNRAGGMNYKLSDEEREEVSGLYLVKKEKGYLATDPFLQH